MRAMPNIKTILDLRNYTKVLKEVKINQSVYLTRNGWGVLADIKYESYNGDFK